MAYKNTDVTGGVVGTVYQQITGFNARGQVETEVYVLAFRGTEGVIDSDMISNLAQGANLNTSQYEQAVDLAIDVYQATGGNVTFVGHSLGGGLAAAAANATGGQAITFNAAGLSSRYNSRSSSGIRAHIIRGDILSSTQNGFSRQGLLMPDTVGTRIYHSPANWYDTSINRHYISQFTRKY